MASSSWRCSRGRGRSTSTTNETGRSRDGDEGARESWHCWVGLGWVLDVGFWVLTQLSKSVPVLVVKVGNLERYTKAGSLRVEYFRSD
jgi:hypothetical protein